MIIEITIWIIGWLFTIGTSASIERDLSQGIKCAIGGILFWPFMLGVMIFDQR